MRRVHEQTPHYRRSVWPARVLLFELSQRQAGRAGSAEYDVVNEMYSEFSSARAGPCLPGQQADTLELRCDGSEERGIAGASGDEHGAL